MSTTPDRQYGRELATEPEVDQKIADHRDRTLLHDLDRDSTMDLVRDSNGRVQFVRFRTATGGPLIRETEVSRDTQGRAATLFDRQFEPPGTLVRTLSFALTRDTNGRLSSASIVTS